jgi:hypothetical protein
MDRRVLEDERARRNVDVRLDQFEDGSPAGDEGLAVGEAVADVFEPADGVEPVPFVVIQRGFLAEGAPWCIR